MSKLILAAAAILALAGPAFAQESREAVSLDAAPTQPVEIRNVDFRDTHQVGRLYDRLTSAAYTVCNTSRYDVNFDVVDQICVHQAVRDAVRAINQPTLTIMSETGRTAQYASR
jgi:UrcA family protein